MMLHNGDEIAGGVGLTESSVYAIIFALAQETN